MLFIDFIVEPGFMFATAPGERGTGGEDTIIVWGVVGDGIRFIPRPFVFVFLCFVFLCGVLEICAFF